MHPVQVREEFDGVVVVPENMESRGCGMTALRNQGTGRPFQVSPQHDVLNEPVLRSRCHACLVGLRKNKYNSFTGTDHQKADELKRNSTNIHRIIFFREPKTRNENEKWKNSPNESLFDSETQETESRERERPSHPAQSAQ